MIKLLNNIFSTRILSLLLLSSSYLSNSTFASSQEDSKTTIDEKIEEDNDKCKVGIAILVLGFTFILVAYNTVSIVKAVKSIYCKNPFVEQHGEEGEKYKKALQYFNYCASSDELKAFDYNKVRAFTNASSITLDREACRFYHKTIYKSIESQYHKLSKRLKQSNLRKKKLNEAYREVKKFCNTTLPTRNFANSIIQLNLDYSKNNNDVIKTHLKKFKLDDLDTKVSQSFEYYEPIDRITSILLESGFVYTSEVLSILLAIYKEKSNSDNEIINNFVNKRKSYYYVGSTLIGFYRDKSKMRHTNTAQSIILPRIVNVLEEYQNT